MKNTIIFIILLGLFACKQDPDPTEPPTGCGMTIDQFPLKVGNSWTYIEDVFDNYTNEFIYRDTIIYLIYKIEISGSDTFFLGKYNSIKFERDNSEPVYLDTILKSKNNLNIYNFLHGSVSGGIVKYNFPLICSHVDTIQKFKEIDPLGSVILIDNYIVKDTFFDLKLGLLKAVKSLEYRIIKTNSTIDHDIYFENYLSPNIGFVKMKINGEERYPFFFPNFEFTLIDFELK
jgi:hypothetical protein